MEYRVDRHDHRLDIEYNKLLRSGSSKDIEADSDEEAKQKTKEWTLEKGIPIDLPDDIEILGEKTPFGFVLVGLKLVDRLKHGVFESW